MQKIFLMIKRIINSKIKEQLFKGKAIILMGSRQIGKTTSLKEIFSSYDNVLWLSGDDNDTQSFFEEITSDRLKIIFGNKKLIIIDEAQRISNIGLKLKLITDNIYDLQLVVTGSSAFELADKSKEPLTGRKWEYQMFPLSFQEMVEHHGFVTEKRLIPHRMVYGYYPEVVTNPGNEKMILKSLSDSYLYKDVLALDYIKKSDKLMKLLQALAYQIGSQVSYNELSQIVGIDAKTIEKYIQVLEKCYIIFRLGSFSRNLRNELTTSRKIYFYDNGIRNAIISNFMQIENRNDIGALWENFLISERMKFTEYNNRWCNKYFWRTKSQQEIDYVEEYDGKLHTYEFKWNENAKVRFPKSFIEAYPDSDYHIVTPKNIEDFLLT